jgi:hypothetical protein
MKLVYEFWGFCVNGLLDQVNAEGFASGGIQVPAGFESGSLLLTGSEGFTYAGESVFRDNSVDFTSGSFVGNHLVAWVSGTNSNDNGIYEIKKIISSGTIEVDVTQGGTPYSGSMVPLFSSRNSIYYRIVDFYETATTTPLTSGSSLVIPLAGAPEVNVSQSISQFRIKMPGEGNDNIEVSLSPSGSWNGEYFDEGQQIVTRDIDWCNGSTGTGHITLMASHDFFISHMRGTWQTAGSGLHVEVPKRIHRPVDDPNPLVAMNWSVQAPSIAPTSLAYGAASTYIHHPQNDTVYAYESFAISPYGTGYPNIYAPNPHNLSTILSGRPGTMVYNEVTDRFFMSDVLLGLRSVPGQYTLGRVKMRRYRLMANVVPAGTRIGANGEWIYVGGGVLWPWDGAVLPHALFRSGL